MKKRTLLLLTSTLFAVAVAMAQDVPAGVVTSLKKGNSQELCKFISDKVDLVILGRSTSADKATTESTLANFFSQNGVKGFTANHEGKRDGSSFIIGTLTTAKGNFRVNCFFKKIGDNYLIHQIRIDKANE